jgi:hypothetical protein
LIRPAYKKNKGPIPSAYSIAATGIETLFRPLCILITPGIFPESGALSQIRSINQRSLLGRVWYCLGVIVPFGRQPQWSGGLLSIYLQSPELLRK